MLPLLAVTVINLISVPLFYRFLGAEMYALWFYVLTFSGAFGFMDLGIGVTVARYVGVALGRGDRNAVCEYWGTGNLIAIPLLGMMALGFTAIGVVFGPAWFNVSPQNASLLRASFVVGGIGMFISYYAYFWLFLSQAHLDFSFLSIVRTATSLLGVIPSIVLAWATGNPLILIAWNTIVAVLQFAVFAWHGRKSYGLGFSFRQARLARAREMAAFTGKTFATLVVNSFLGSADRLLLGKLASPANFTHYMICTNVGSRIQALSASAMAPIYCTTSQAFGSGKKESAAGAYDEIFDFVFPWYVLISVIACLWHPVLLRVWVGDEVAAAVAPLFAPIIVGCCLTAIANISASQLGPLDRAGTGLTFSILTGIALFSCVYLGWHQAGMVGVAWGFLVSRVPLIVQDLFVLRLIEGHGGWLGRKAWLTVGAQMAVGFGIYALSRFLPSDSLLQIVPVAIHSLLVGGWLLRRLLAGLLIAPAARSTHQLRTEET